MGEISKATNDILWSLWSELGIPGSGRRHRHLLADPEPLIVCTPLLAATDNRLLGLVFDWCVAHSDVLSKSRIKAIAHSSTSEVQQALARFNGALEHHGVRWSPTGEPGNYSVGLQTVSLPLERPSLLRLRMRALAGVSARAEVLTLLLSTEQNTLTADDLMVPGVSRRSVERVVAELAQGGFLTLYGKQRGRRFTLNNRLAFAAFFGHTAAERLCLPVNWHLLLLAVVHLNALQHCEGLSESLRRVEAVKIRNELAHLMKEIHQMEPPIVSGRVNAVEQIVSWATARIGEWARGKSFPESI